MTPSLIFFSAIAAAVVAAWAFGHWGTAGIAAKVNAAKAVLASAETKAGGTLASLEQAFVHPVATVQHIDHAAALKAIEVATNVIAYMGDHTDLLAQKAAIEAVIATRVKGLSDAAAKIEAILAKQ